MPPLNWGASRVICAAAVNISAPRAPMAKPSSVSRSPGRTRRTSAAGTSMSTSPADGDAETVAEDPGPGDAHAESDVVLLGEHRTRQQHPSDTEADAQSGGHHQDAGGHVVVDVGLLEIDEEQQRKAKRGNGDQAAGTRNRVVATRAANDHAEPEQERHARAGRQVWEQRADDVRRQEMLAGRGAVGLDPQPLGTLGRPWSFRGSPQRPQIFACRVPRSRHTRHSTMPSGISSVSDSVLMARPSAGGADCGRGCRRSVCRVR